jgi:antitoxin component YwqK of YwqJK toxin-antitoxin module
MLHRLPLILLLLSASACNAPSASQPAEVVQRYQTGVVSRRFYTLNGQKQGKMTDYYNDGRLMAERQFVADKQTGRTLIYYPGGQVKEVQYYLDGKKNGGDTLWYEDGRIQFVSHLQDDKMHGYLRKWAPDGTLVFEAKYDQDTLIEVKGQPIDRNVSAAKPSAVLKRQ